MFKLLAAFGFVCVALAVRIPTSNYHRAAPAPVAAYKSAPQYEEIHYPHGPIIVKRREDPLKEKHEEEQKFENIPGVPGHDYPIYHSVPQTSFSCKNVPVVPGMYANPETGCQAYHVCHDGHDKDFLCTNGTLFNQAIFACDWWYNVDCHQSQGLWRLNADPELNPYTPKKKLPEHEHDFI